MRRLAGLSLCLFLSLSFAGCKGDPSKPEYWEKKIGESKGKKERLRSVEELRSSKFMGPPMLTMLHARLDAEKSPEVKAAIARLLGEQKDKGGVDSLMNAIDPGGSDTETKSMNKEIALSLGTIGDPKAVPALVKMLSIKDNFTVIAAIEAIGALHAKEGYEALDKIASDDTIETFITKKAIIALGDVGDPRAVPTITRLMFKERKGVSFYLEASFALYQIGQPAADFLVPIVEQKDKAMTDWAAGNNVLPAALTAKSAQVLGDLHELKAEKALIGLLGYKDDKLDIQLFVRMRAGDALGRMRSKESVKALSAALLETEPTARQAYAWALNRIGGRDALPKAIESASKGSWEARLESMKTIAMLGDDREFGAMDDFIKKEDKQFDAECKSDDFGGSRDCGDVPASIKKHAELMGKYRKALEAAKECKADAACWVKKLDDATLVVRERAAYEVGRSNNAALVGELTKRLREADLDARLAIIQGCDWLVHDSKDAMKAAQGGLADLTKQLGEERGKTEFVKVNEDLRRLHVKIERG